MDDPLGNLPIGYLLETSDIGLQNALMQHLAAASVKRKELRILLEEWIQEEAIALVFKWFLEHGHEIAALLTSPPTAKALPDGEPGSQTAEDFREGLRRLLKSG